MFQFYWEIKSSVVLHVIRGLKIQIYMRPLKKYGIHINKYVHTKKFFFQKNRHIMVVENFNGGAKYEETTNFNSEKLFLFKTSKHFEMMHSIKIIKINCFIH